jgi:hypothetical protein
LPLVVVGRNGHERIFVVCCRAEEPGTNWGAQKQQEVRAHRIETPGKKGAGRAGGVSVFPLPAAGPLDEKNAELGDEN